MGMPQMQMPGGVPKVQGPHLQGPQMQAPQFNASGPSFQGGHLQGPQAHASAPQVRGPQMQAPHLQAAPMPAMGSLKAPALPKGKMSMQTILIVIMVLVAFLAGGLIVFLLVRK